MNHLVCIKEVHYYEAPLRTVFLDVTLTDVRWNKQGQAALSECEMIFSQSAKPRWQNQLKHPS